MVGLNAEPCVGAKGGSKEDTDNGMRFQGVPTRVVMTKLLDVALMSGCLQGWGRDKPAMSGANM